MIEAAVALIIGLALLTGTKKPEEAPKSELLQCVEACEAGVITQYKACKCKDKPWKYK